jgi:hypothetical protein
MAAHMRVAEKWDGKLSASQTVPGDWKERTRWAEARRDAALMKANEAGLVKHAAMVHFERQLKSIERSASWRLTKPLRWLKSRLGRRSDGDAPRATVAGEKAASSAPSTDGAPVPWSADQK